MNLKNTTMKLLKKTSFCYSSMRYENINYLTIYYQNRKFNYYFN